jgi:hypothetical protein
MPPPQLRPLRQALADLLLRSDDDNVRRLTLAFNGYAARLYRHAREDIRAAAMFRTCDCVEGMNECMVSLEHSESGLLGATLLKFRVSFDINMRKFLDPACNRKLPADYVEGVIANAAKVVDGMLVPVPVPVACPTVREAAIKQCLGSDEEDALSDIL